MPVSMHSACMVWCLHWHWHLGSLIHLNVHLSEWLYARNDLSRTCIAQCKNMCLQDAGLQLHAPMCLCFCSCVLRTQCLHLCKCMYGTCNGIAMHTHRADRQTDQTDRQAGRQTDRQDRQTDRTDRQTGQDRTGQDRTGQDRIG